MAFFSAEREARFEAGINKNVTPTCIVHSSKIIDCSETILAALKRRRRKNVLCTAIVFTVGCWKRTIRHACISWISKKAIRRSALRSFEYITQLTCAVSFALHWLLAGFGRKHHAVVVLCNYNFWLEVLKSCVQKRFFHTLLGRQNIAIFTFYLIIWLLWIYFFPWRTDAPVPFGVQFWEPIWLPIKCLQHTHSSHLQNVDEFEAGMWILAVFLQMENPRQ